MTPTPNPWPDNALTINFRFDDGTANPITAVYDVVAHTFVANGNEAYAR